MKKQEIMQELKEAIEQTDANQKRQILYMIKLIYQHREDFDRDKKLEEALKNYLEVDQIQKKSGTTFEGRLELYIKN